MKKLEKIGIISVYCLKSSFITFLYSFYFYSLLFIVSMLCLITYLFSIGNSFYNLFNFVLIFFILFHSVSGLVHILEDYVFNKRVRILVKTLLWLVLIKLLTINIYFYF